MVDLGVLEEMSEGELLDAAGVCAETARCAEVDLLLVAYQWAVVHCADRLDPAESSKPGWERARQLGGPGVPEVTEFAAAELGVRIGRSPYAAVTTTAARIAERLPDHPDRQTEDERRVRALLLLVTGTDLDGHADDDADTRGVLPAVQLIVHTYGGPDREGVMRVEGHGPVTEEWVREVLGPRARFTILPVLDLAGQAPVDAYEVPDRHRQAVHLMTPADTFPYASCTSGRMQVDHTVPFDEGGESGIGSYGPMTTGHHRVKTHGRLDVRQPFPGIYIWRDTHGAYFLVDHTGTRQVTRRAA